MQVGDSLADPGLTAPARFGETGPTMKSLPTACLLAVTLVAASAEAQKKRGEEHSADCQVCWEGASGIELAVPLWLPVVGLDGQGKTDDGTTQRLTYDPELQFAFIAQLRWRIGPVGIDLTVNGGGLGTQIIRSQEGEPLGEVDLAAFFGKAAFNLYTPAYRVGQGSRASRLAIWPYLGLRYALLSGKGAAADQSMVLDGKTSWGEPLFGVKMLLDMRRGWLFGVEGDVGGFGVGSEISGWVNAKVQYAITDWWNLWLGWVLYYSRFAPNDSSEFELMLQGPGIGLGIPLF